MTLFSGLKHTELILAVCPVYFLMYLPQMTSVSTIFLSPPPLMNLELSLLMSTEQTSQLWMYLQFLIIRFREGLQRLTLRSQEPVMQYSPWLLYLTVQMGPVCTFTNYLGQDGSLSISLLRMTIFQSIINHYEQRSRLNIFESNSARVCFIYLARKMKQKMDKAISWPQDVIFNLNDNFNLVQQQGMSNWTKSALEVLKETSRTFYIPIVKLPPVVQQAVASAYLCLRAIDQVQDHPQLPNQVKAEILQNISISLQKFSPSTTLETMTFEWGQEKEKLPEVTLRLAQWVFYCPESFRGRIAECTASMSDRMRYWAERNWRIDNEEDLDVYTMAVAGAVGLILCEIWDWFESTKTDRTLAIAYGRCLQSVNILRNNHQDSQRGVTFYPPKWTQQDMLNYSKKNLTFATKYVSELKQGTSAKIFCEIPIALAEATLEIMQNGGQKLTREQVMKICKLAA